MGKTYLLRSLAKQCGGFYFGATAATQAESLRQFGQALAEHAGVPGALRLDTWDEAITTLFRIARSASQDRPMLVAIDEFPYLAKEAKELPSVIQRELDRYQSEPLALRMLLRGSAMATMGLLLAGSAYRINEPLITFYEAIMRPLWSVLSQGRAEQAWQRSAS
jgi:hypothetical protein